MALLPITRDEPAIQDALVGVIVKLILGLLASAGLTIGDNLTAGISVAVAAVVAAVVGYAQGKVTRSKVVPVATAMQLAPGLGWPTDVRLPAELTVTDAPLG